MNTYQSIVKKVLPIVTISVLTSFIGLNLAFAELYCGASKIPDEALSKGGNKVTICHFPPGNPDNYQVITISTSALNTHCDHHDDIFATNGICPPIKSSVQWQYLNGPGSWNPDNGKPNNVGKSSCTIPDDLMLRVKQNLPEGKSNIGSFGTSASKTNISLKSTAKLSVAYLTEGAGYNNAIGFFNFNTADMSTLEKASLGNLSTSTVYAAINEKIIFPNLSNDILSIGDSVDLGQFMNGTSVGFTLISDGWVPSSGMVDNNQSDKNIFRTIRSLNTEKGVNTLDAHALLFSDIKNGLLILAFEDLNRDTTSANSQGLVSDNDFNDVVLAVCVSPFTAVDDVDELPVFAPYVPVAGQSGQVNWSEQNMPTEVVDPIKENKAKALTQ